LAGAVNNSIVSAILGLAFWSVEPTRDPALLFTNLLYKGIFLIQQVRMVNPIVDSHSRQGYAGWGRDRREVSM